MSIPAANVRTPATVLREVFDDTLNRRDAGALIPHWTEDIVEELPVGRFVGRQAVRDYFASTFAAIPDFRIEARTIVAEGATAFVRWRLTGTFAGALWMGIRPNGAAIALDGMDCITFRGEQIAHNFVVYDQLAFARQIGMLPSAGGAIERAMTAAFNLRSRLRRNRHAPS